MHHIDSHVSKIVEDHRPNLLYSPQDINSSESPLKNNDHYRDVISGQAYNNKDISNNNKKRQPMAQIFFATVVKATDTGQISFSRSLVYGTTLKCQIRSVKT